MDISLLGPKHNYTASAQQMLEVCNKALNEVSSSNSDCFRLAYFVGSVSGLSGLFLTDGLKINDLCLPVNGRKFNSS